MDEYADWQAGGGLVDALAEAGFRDVRIAAATGRHFALVARLAPPPPPLGTTTAFKAAAVVPSSASEASEASEGSKGRSSSSRSRSSSRSSSSSSSGRGGASGGLGLVLDDRRFDAAGRYVKEDTHLKTWESKKKNGEE